MQIMQLTENSDEFLQCQIVYPNEISQSDSRMDTKALLRILAEKVLNNPYNGQLVADCKRKVAGRELTRLLNKFSNDLIPVAKMSLAAFQERMRSNQLRFDPELIERQPEESYAEIAALINALCSPAVIEKVCDDYLVEVEPIGI